MTSLAPCTACLDHFTSQEEWRDHYKSDRHTYNLKRKQQNLKPVSEELWTQKLRDFSGVSKRDDKKGTAHLKKRVPKSEPSSIVYVESDVLAYKDRTECDCLFNDTRFSSIEENLAYMEKKYSFFLPYPQYLKKPKELILYLQSKIYEGFTCLYCDAIFVDTQSVLRHMLDKGHTRIGTEGYTRTGQFSQERTEELLAQLAPFYDFSGSMAELNPNKNIIPSDQLKAIMAKQDDSDASDDISDEEKIKTLFDVFDEDEDGLLNYEEAYKLYAHNEDEDEPDFSQEQYGVVLQWLGTPEGISIEGVAKIYEQLGSLDIDYEKLDGWVDLDSEYDVKEAKDEEEFERLMKEFGLERAQILPNGDLKLPSGNIAAHRQFHYIYKQRGRRWTEEERRNKCQAIADGAVRNNLMIGNGRSVAGSTQIAVSKREMHRQGKQIIVMLRHQQKRRRRLGEKQNIIQKRTMGKFTSILGDAAGGR